MYSDSYLEGHHSIARGEMKFLSQTNYLFQTKKCVNPALRRAEKKCITCLYRTVLEMYFFMRSLPKWFI